MHIDLEVRYTWIMKNVALAQTKEEISHLPNDGTSEDVLEGVRTAIQGLEGVRFELPSLEPIFDLLAQVELLLSRRIDEE